MDYLSPSSRENGANFMAKHIIIELKPVAYIIARK